MPANCISICDRNYSIRRSPGRHNRKCVHPSSIDAHCQGALPGNVTCQLAAETVTRFSYPCARLFFLIGCGGEGKYFGAAAFAVIITGMNDGARGQGICERRTRRPKPDNDGTPQHLRQRPGHIHQGTCRVLRPRPCTANLGKRFMLEPKGVKLYHWREIESFATSAK